MKLAGHLARMHALFKGHGSGLYGGDIAVRLLHEAAAACRQVMHDMRRLWVESPEIDDIYVRF